MPLAENRGFEPMMELIHNYFQDSHLKPLGQFSLLVTISLYIVCNRSLLFKYKSRYTNYH